MLQACNVLRRRHCFINASTPTTKSIVYANICRLIYEIALWYRCLETLTPGSSYEILSFNLPAKGYCFITGWMLWNLKPGFTVLTMLAIGDGDVVDWCHQGSQLVYCSLNHFNHFRCACVEALLQQANSSSGYVGIQLHMVIERHSWHIMARIHGHEINYNLMPLPLSSVGSILAALKTIATPTPNCTYH